jgi:hypothetical protein
MLLVLPAPKSTKCERRFIEEGLKRLLEPEMI